MIFFMSSARIVYRKNDRRNLYGENQNGKRKENGEIFLNLKLMETKPGELDRRLENWLHSIDGIDYLTEPDKIIFHE